jgi:hypothetical protein
MAIAEDRSGFARRADELAEQVGCPVASRLLKRHGLSDRFGVYCRFRG